MSPIYKICLQYTTKKNAQFVEKIGASPIYKICLQYTTQWKKAFESLESLVTNLQNLSSIHNFGCCTHVYLLDVTNLQNLSSIHNKKGHCLLQSRVTNLQNLSSIHNSMGDMDQKKQVTNLQNLSSIHNILALRASF